MRGFLATRVRCPRFLHASRSGLLSTCLAPLMGILSQPTGLRTSEGYGFWYSCGSYTLVAFPALEVAPVAGAPTRSNLGTGLPSCRVGWVEALGALACLVALACFPFFLAFDLLFLPITTSLRVVEDLQR